MKTDTLIALAATAGFMLWAARRDAEWSGRNPPAPVPEPNPPGPPATQEPFPDPGVVTVVPVEVINGRGRFTFAQYVSPGPPVSNPDYDQRAYIYLLQGKPRRIMFSLGSPGELKVYMHSGKYLQQGPQDVLVEMTKGSSATIDIILPNGSSRTVVANTLELG